MRALFSVVTVVFLQCAVMPAIALPQDDEDESERVVDDEDTRPPPRKKPKKKQPVVEEEQAEELAAPGDKTGPIAGVSAGGAVCAALSLNWIGSAIAAGAGVAVAFIPSFFCLQSPCAAILSCSACGAGIAAVGVALLSAVAGGVAAPFAGGAAANVLGKRRVPLAGMGAAVMASNLVVFAIGSVVAIPLGMTAVIAGIVVGQDLYELQARRMYGFSSLQTTAQLQQEIQMFSVILGVTVAAMAAAPFVGLLVGNGLGSIFAGLIAATSGRGMRGSESGYFFDFLSVPDRTDDEKPVKRARKKKRAKPRDDDDQAEEKPRPKAKKAKPKPPEEEEFEAAEPLDEAPPASPILPTEEPSAAEEPVY